MKNSANNAFRGRTGAIHHLQTRSLWAVLILPFAFCLLPWRAYAFPPAPHHVIHGTVRDEMGEPLSLTLAQVFLETTNGVTISVEVQPGVRPGENYRLVVPMDSGTALDPYKPIALRPAIPFRLKVKIGAAIYLPIEMAGDFSNLGKPAGETLLNLTLGVDSDGDGLPDAWEYAMIQALGGGLTLADITPGGDNDHDGISNYQEYIAGTYAFSAEDGLKLSLVRRSGQGPVIQFFTIAGRNYAVQATTNLVNWSDVAIRVPPGDVNAAPVASYYGLDAEIVETEVVLPAGEPKAIFFRVRVY